MLNAGFRRAVPTGNVGYPVHVIPRRGLLVVLATVACGDGRAAMARTEARSSGITVENGRPFEDVFEVVGSVRLEESGTVVTVSPRVAPDRDGGILVADPSEHQVRLYTAGGRLRDAIGAGTPRELSMSFPQRARRMPNGDLLVANLQGLLTLIPVQSNAEPTLINIPLRTVRDFEILDSEHVVVAGTDSAPPSATLFLVDLTERRITTRFFPPPPHLDPWVTTYFSTVKTASRGGRLAAVHMLSDTLTFFSGSGSVVSRQSIPITPFRVPLGPLPDLTTERERQEWSSQFTIVSNVWWIADDVLIVQWHKPKPGQGMEWGILRMDTSGVRAWAIAPAPHLYAVSGDRFLFRDPRADVPNQWLVAKEKS